MYINNIIYVFMYYIDRNHVKSSVNFLICIWKATSKRQASKHNEIFPIENMLDIFPGDLYIVQNYVFGSPKYIFKANCLFD